MNFEQTRSVHDTYLDTDVVPSLQALGFRCVSNRPYHETMSQEDAAALRRLNDRTTLAERTRPDRMVLCAWAGVWIDAKVIGTERNARSRNFFVEAFAFFNALHKSFAGQRTVYFCQWPGLMERACIIDHRLAKMVANFWRFGNGRQSDWALQMFREHCPTTAELVQRLGGNGSGTDAVRIDLKDVRRSDLFFDWRREPHKLFDGLQDLN